MNGFLLRNHEIKTATKKIETNFKEINSNFNEKTLTENRKEYEKSSILSHKCTRKKYKSCHNVPIECLDCSIDNNPNAANCIYGELMKTNCTIKNRTECVVRNLIF